MYSLSSYGSMIADRVRVDAYAQALRRCIHEGSVVVEVGTGTGIFAVLACQLGASRVYAIETDGIIQLAREVAAANHCEDRIEFIEDLSTRVTLPVRADVLLSDLRGALPFFGRHIPALSDARRRFLAPDGAMIPRKDTLWVAVVEAPGPYSEITDAWEHSAFGQDLRPALRRVVNTHHRVRVTEEELLTTPQLWATLNYATVETPDIRGELTWTVERAGTGFGIVVWFDADLTEGVGFSCGPGTPDGVYGPLFFPWEQPVPLVVGQSVCVDLETKLIKDNYTWRWTTRVASPDGSGGILFCFEQSQLNGEVFSLRQLHKTASDYVPQLSEDGLLDRRIFELMDGRTTLEEIARKLVMEYPQRFSRWQDALTAAGVVSAKYSR
jgi:type I protein arginine methyltransferase